jgi:hypothetical protein
VWTFNFAKDSAGSILSDAIGDRSGVQDGQKLGRSDDDGQGKMSTMGKSMRLSEGRGSMRDRGLDVSV